MGSQSAIIGVWGLLEGAGLVRPWLTTEASETALVAWGLVLADVPDERLTALAVAWLRGPEARYGRWPLPGALLHAIPQPSPLDDADGAWADALGMLRTLGVERCPATVEELEDRRARLRAGVAEAEARGDARAADRRRRLLALLPRSAPEALLAGVAACGGWRGLGRAEDEALIAHRASFRAAWRAVVQRGAASETEAAVAGLLDTRPGYLRLAGRET